jgi:hypothetical protein
VILEQMEVQQTLQRAAAPKSTAKHSKDRNTKITKVGIQKPRKTKSFHDKMKVQTRWCECQNSTLTISSD